MFCRLGFVTGEAAGRRADLVEGGVDAAFGVGELRQRVEVGRLELGELTVLEDERGDGVVLGQLFEDVLRGGDDLALAVLHRLGQEHLVEEDVAELLGRVDVEAVAGLLVDLSARLSISTARRLDMVLRTVESMRTPACSMRRRTGTSGRSMVS